MTDITMFAGNSHAFRVSILDEELALDLTGATITFKTGLSPRADATVFEKSIDNGIEMINEDQGIIEITLDPIDTLGLAYNLWWQVDVTEATGRYSTVASGYLIIQPNLSGVGDS